LLAFAGMVACASAEPAAEPKLESAKRDSSYVVVLRPGHGEADIREVFGRFELDKIRDLGSGMYEIRIRRPATTLEMEEAAATNPAVSSVEPNTDYKAK
jgi:hypothetical protein